MKISYVLCLWLLRAVLGQSSCNFYYYVNTTVYITSPGYPMLYKGGLQCRWIAECPPGYNCRLNCPLIELPQSQGCKLDQLLVSKSGDPQLAGADTYCGRGSLTVVSTGQRIVMGLITNLNTPGGRISCQVSPQPATPSTQCRCGEKRQNRIVGGKETGVNEYKMMAGLVDSNIRRITCGGVIISERYVLTAAHCGDNLSVQDMLVLVGEHDVSTGNDTPAAKLYTVVSFRKHPMYNKINYDYDIAIVTVDGRIQFNDRVGPACLPFKFVSKDFTGSKVTVLGWGTQFIGGPISNVLMEAELDVISQRECASRVQNLTYRQICTYTRGKDACQFDSGGPLLYMDPATALSFNVGIVSSGQFCAEANSPGVNTRVPALLDWITSNAPADYCVK